MPINVYTGLMRSGKSYEVVSMVILEAILRGRRVVTNVDGISNDLIRAYVSEKKGVDLVKLGEVVHVTNADVFKEDFFPYFDDGKAAHTDTIVQPGDLVCIDEAWRFWPASGVTIHKNHKSFFLEHGHFTNEATGVACDLVLMIQDMSTLNRFVKNVVAFNFRTHKKVSLGLGNTYSVTGFEGHKQTKATRIGEWVRRYNKEIFPLYSSFKGGVQGKTVNVDSRQNIFANKRLWFTLALCIGGGAYSAYNVWRFFHPSPVTAKTVSDDAATSKAGDASKSGGKSPVAPSRPSGVPFSETWRVVGSLSAHGERLILIANGAGMVRAVSPSMFTNEGLLQVGEVDGERVTVWTGAGAVRSSNGVGVAR